MNLFGFFKKLRPAERIAVLVDTVLDRINEKYELQSEFWMEGGKVKATHRVVDRKPQTTMKMPERDE